MSRGFKTVHPSSQTSSRMLRITCTLKKCQEFCRLMKNILLTLSPPPSCPLPSSSIKLKSPPPPPIRPFIFLFKKNIFPFLFIFSHQHKHRLDSIHRTVKFPRPEAKSFGKFRHLSGAAGRQCTERHQQVPSST